MDNRVNRGTTANKHTLSKQAMQFIGVQRVQGGYTLYDNLSGNMLATLMVVNSANDVINTRLRDGVISLYYEYGKKLGYYC